MLPSLIADDLRTSLTRFLGTTFALADDDVRVELERFVADPDGGVFRGPFVQLRLPFQAAGPGWPDPLDWTPTGLHPHEHQARAWRRLSSRDTTPQATLITTGTGSGKTEGFMVPLLDHCRRERCAGRAGIKALVLYPMNALANDQARRLAGLIHTHRDQLGAVTVGLYTGDAGTAQSMTANSVIEDRATLRRHPPDILLTNYKMLDMLLLRSEDTPLFADAARTLRYLVLDELHTYDGAQGTDVAMLLRRLGMAIGSGDDVRPLGSITPVGTSATLGEDGDGGVALRRFAERVFGCPFDPSSVIGESRLTVNDWVGPTDPGLRVPLLDDVTARLATASGHHEMLRHGAELFLGDPDTDPGRLGAALRAHPFTRALIDLTQTPRSVVDLATRIEPTWLAMSGRRRAQAGTAVSVYLALLSTARGPDGRPLLTVDVQLWLREVSRVLRRFDAVPRFHWFEDAPTEDGEQTLASVFCRQCGRSGWAAVATAGGEHSVAPPTVWARAVTDPRSLRAWIFAPREAEQGATAVRWVDPHTMDYVATGTHRPEGAIPVLATPDAAAAKREQCPSCGVENSIRFLGSRVATLVSAALGQLFANPDVEHAEKKALIFTDSVQDASHRAAFVEGRAFALNLRATMHRALGPDGCRLHELGARMEATGTTPEQRYALVPPHLHNHKTFMPYWGEQPGDPTRQTVARRMGFAATCEFGLFSRIGRTLELTGAATVEVEVRDVSAVLRTVGATVRRQEVQAALDGSDADLSPGWLYGIVERIRRLGGIKDPWLLPFATRAQRYLLNGGRKSREGMPAFGTRGAAPRFPTTASHVAHFDPIRGRGRYSTWTARTLGVPIVDANRYVHALLTALTADGTLERLDTVGGASLWWIAPDRVIITPASSVGPPPRLRCRVCSESVPGPSSILFALQGLPCLRDGCPGRYDRDGGEDDYYRRLYLGAAVRRMVAREHTSLLPAPDRLALEAEFAAGEGPTAPNVLTCTPTLELGIDIGDLSTVALTSLPRSTASYLQRVGRAGRSTGNALVLAILPARSLELHHLADPTTMIAGAVMPPACHLDATEILRRQYLASLIDRRSRSDTGSPPRLAIQVLGKGCGPGSWLGGLIADARANAARYVAAFLRGFADHVSHDSAEALAQWAGVGVAPTETSGLQRAITDAATAWQAESDLLADRLAALQAEVTTYAARPTGDEEDERELRRLRGELAATRAARSTRERQYWISAMEARGLLPNYALLDDRTTLDVGLWWTDEETGEHHAQDDRYLRGSRTALTELAPGATFYVRGTSVEIDAIDLGTSRRPATIGRRYCPRCGWSAATVDTAPGRTCSRCGSTDAADVGQVLTTLPFRRASAYGSRDRALRDDDTDDRRRTRFEIVTTVDVDPSNVTVAWRLAGYPFGVEVLRVADVHWVNLGPVGRGGRPVTIAGHDRAAALFHACTHCGIVPQAQPTSPDPTTARHRGWCRQRRQHDPSAWTTVALTHDLRTQAARILVPPVVIADPTVLTSLRAALLVGLREVLGGEPDHLDIVEAVDPSGGLPARWTLVLHDLVPGGTGYLAGLGDPGRVRELLDAARRVVRDCPCRSEGSTACHRCLLPHVAPNQAHLARRDTAEAVLDEILDQWRPVAIHGLADISTAPHDTPIERRFRHLLGAWATARSATVARVGGGSDEGLQCRLPIGDGTRLWRLMPQIGLGDARPDFMLTCPDPEVPDIAVFCDGARYHSSTTVNRIAEDAEARTALRDRGLVVWSVTHQDLDAFDAALRVSRRDGSQAEIEWLSPARLKAANRVAERRAVPGSASVESLAQDPVSFLTAFLLNPRPEAWEGAAQAITIAHAMGESRLSVDPAITPGLLHATLGGTDLHPTPGSLPVSIVRSPRGAVLIVEIPDVDTVRVTLGVDDRAEVVGTPDQLGAWRDWLALSNVLQFLGPDRMGMASTTSTPSVPPSSPPVLDPAWHELFDVFDEPMTDLLRALADSELPVPEAGLELDGGAIVIDLAWPAVKVAVTEDTAAHTWLHNHGWRVVAPDAAAVRTALTTSGGSRWA